MTETVRGNEPKRRSAGSKPALAGAAGKPVARRRGERSTYFLRLVNNPPENPLALIDSIRQGFPAGVVKEASEFFEIPEKRVLAAVGLAATTAHRLLKADKPVDPATSERMNRIASLTRRAIEVFGTEENARVWMTRSNLALGDNAPLDLLDTEVGAQAVERVLVAIETGGVV